MTLGAVSQQGSSTLSGTMSYLDVGGEQTVFELTPAGRVIIHGIFLDFVNMTFNGTIKLYLKIDGTTYRQFDDDLFLVAEHDGIFLDFNAMIESDLKITYEEAGDEGADRAIPYTLGYEEKS